MPFLLAEGALQVADLLSHTVHVALLRPEERWAAVVEGRGNIYHPEHDAAGYRNAARPARAALVVLGDSHAYGTGVAAAEAWPRLIGAYNMALPGFGQGDHLGQLDEAMALQPTTLIVGVYFGNDFVETFITMQRRPDLFASVSRSADAAAAEARRPIIAEFGELFRLGEAPDPSPPGLQSWLGRHVKLYAFARALGDRLSPPPPTAVLDHRYAVAVAALSPVQQRHTVPIEEDGWRTILTPAYRGKAVDAHDPRVRLGFEASVAALLQIAKRCQRDRVRMLVVLLPTKESVFWPRGGRDARVRQAVQNEAQFRDELTTRLRGDGLNVLDALPVLHSALAQPYFEDVDGHPNALGHRLIAEAVAAKLR